MLSGAGLSIALLILTLQTTPPTPEPAAATSQPATASQPMRRGIFEPSGFLLRELTLAPGTEPLRYCVFVPPQYDPARPWPVIVFLHGSGERGTDGLLQTEVGIGTAIRRNPGFPAIVVMPQCPPGRAWDEPMLLFAIRCLDEVDQRYHLDRERLYVTGMSMGGYGAWFLGGMLSRNVAAVAPICGFISDPRNPPAVDNVRQLVQALKDIPIWAVHGAKDPAVSVEHTRAMVDALQLAGATQLRYQEIAEGGHNTWDQTYASPEFWKWLLAQRRTSGASSQPTSAPATSQPGTPGD